MKCEKCGKKIQYNRYTKVKGKYYCPECVPKTKIVGSVTLTVDDFVKIVSSTKKAKEDAESFGVTTDELSAAISTVPKKKPSKRKHRGN